MKYFLFGVVCATSLLALLPLPPLPPIGGFKSNDDKAPSVLLSTNSSSVASAAPKDLEGPRLPPIMIDAKEGSQALISADDGADRSKNIDDVLKSVSEIEQQVLVFQSVEQEVDGLYAGVHKKLDEFFMEVDGFIGQVGSYAQDLESDLAKKGPELKAYNRPTSSLDVKKTSDDAVSSVESSKTALEELKKLLTASKDGRSALAREEDTVRQKVVDFKKNSDEVGAFYAQAISVKNGLLVKGGDTSAGVRQCADIAKKAREFVDSLKVKNSVEIKNALKRIEGMVAAADDAKKAIVAKLDALKKVVAAISKAENELSMEQMAEELKNVEPVMASNVVPKNEKNKPIIDTKSSGVELDANADVGQATSARANMRYEVLATIQQGIHLLVDKAQGFFAGVIAWGKGFFVRVSASVVEEKSDSVSIDAQKGAEKVVLAAHVPVVAVKKELAVEPKALVSPLLPGGAEAAVDVKKQEQSTPKSTGLPPLPNLAPVPKPL